MANVNDPGDKEALNTNNRKMFFHDWLETTLGCSKYSSYSK